MKSKWRRNTYTSDEVKLPSVDSGMDREKIYLKGIIIVAFMEEVRETRGLGQTPASM